MYYPKFIAFFQRYFSYKRRYFIMPAACFYTFGFCRQTIPTLKKPKDLKFPTAGIEYYKYNL